MKILSSFTRPQVVEYKSSYIFKNFGNQTVDKNTMEVNEAHFDILQNIFFCSIWWKNFHFWVNYPFNLFIQQGCTDLTKSDCYKILLQKIYISNKCCSIELQLCHHRHTLYLQTTGVVNCNNTSQYCEIISYWPKHTNNYQFICISQSFNIYASLV